MDMYLSRTFSETWLKIHGAYEEYAKSKKMNYTSMMILYFLNTEECCTQKQLCEKAALPKQTVHSIITGLYKEKLVEMQELPEDRRIKRILLTEKGKEYSRQVIPPILEAEKQAVQRMTEEEIETMMRLYNRYTSDLVVALKNESIRRMENE